MGTVVIIIIWLAGAFAGGVVGQLRGRWGLGVALGAILSVLGVVIIACIPKDYDKLARQEAQLAERAARERQLRQAARERL